MRSILAEELYINRQSVFHHMYTERLEQIRARTLSYNLTCIKGLLFLFFFFILKMFVALSSHPLYNSRVQCERKGEKITRNFSPETLFLTKF